MQPGIQLVFETMTKEMWKTRYDSICIEVLTYRAAAAG